MEGSMKITVKSSGNLEKKLNELKNNAAALQGQHQIALKDLLTPTFVAGCSSYASLDDLFTASPFTINTLDDFKAIPDAEWDTFISTNTSFATWEEMQHAAMREYVRGKLGFA
jgi:hypothetical protein